MYRSNTEVYAGESIALELDVIFPPWSGSNPINFTFQPQTLVFPFDKDQQKKRPKQYISSAVLLRLLPFLEDVQGWDCWRVGRFGLFEPRARRISGELPGAQQVLHQISHPIPPTMVSKWKFKLQTLLLRFEDVGTLQVNGICPTQLHAKGKNKFRARGIFENIPGQNSFFKGEVFN